VTSVIASTAAAHSSNDEYVLAGPLSTFEVPITYLLVPFLFPIDVLGAVVVNLVSCDVKRDVAVNRGPVAGRYGAVSGVALATSKTCPSHTQQCPKGVRNMAKKNKDASVEGSDVVEGGVNGNGNMPTDDEMGAEFQTIETDRLMFKADTCHEKPLIGWLIDKVEMPAIKGRAWDAFVIRVTEPGLAQDRDGEVVETKVGQEVLIPATYVLAQFMSRAAGHPTLGFKVFIKPKKKIEIGGGQSMWQYKLGVNPKGRSLQELGIEMLRAVPQHKALPTRTSDADTAGADVPFS